MDFQATILKKHARSTKSHTPESRYWRRFKYPVFIKGVHPITHVHFSPSAPHRYAVSAGMGVQIYAPRTQKIYKNIERFDSVAYSANIRQDGKLIAAGEHSGRIQIFDINSRAILRTLKEHVHPVRVAKFSPINQTELISADDHGVVKLWDIPSQTPITTFHEHTDAVRSGHILPTNPHLILTGSYDSTIRLFDTRTGECSMTMSCASSSAGSGAGAGVEDVLPFPSGTMLVSASGSAGILRVWDLVAGGRCVRAMSNHQKTVTCLAFDSTASRLLSGGLDQMVKVYDVSTYKVVHTMRYPAQVLCLAVSPDDTHIGVGMQEGTFSIRRRQPKASEEERATAALPQKDAFQALLDGDNILQNNKSTPATKKKIRIVGDANELRVESKRRKVLRDYDKLLKAFKYSAALDAVLKKSIRPTVSFSLITELVHRDALRSALSGRDDVLLEPILHLLVKYVDDPRFGELVCDVSLVVIEMYGSAVGQSPLIDGLFVKLRKKVQAEIRLQRELVSIRGALDMLLASSTLGPPTPTPAAAAPLQPITV